LAEFFYITIIKMTKVFLHTEQHPEDNAMLQALYSRSADSVEVHKERLAKVGSGKFMAQYYLGYGHASIADCGFITLYIEGVSMLAAKAIQDEPLYNGQESSSRYIDWSEQPFYNPFVDSGNPLNSAMHGKHNVAEDVLNSMRSFYVTQKPIIIEHLKQQFPRKENEKEGTYDKAITAKAFDILRGFLPCGATTNVAWTTSLRKANEHVRYLALHPLEEIRDVAKQLHSVLVESYPNSIDSEFPDYDSADPYLKDFHQYYTSTYGQSGYFRIESAKEILKPYIGTISFDYQAGLVLNRTPAIDRPKRAKLLKHNLGYRDRLSIMCDLDFGSYRDLQRHRGGYCGVPVISAGGDFHPWYYEQLPESSKHAADKLFKQILEFNNRVCDVHELEMQYILPMGTLVEVILDYDVNQSLYVAELRSSQTVHSTLRPVAQAIGRYLENIMGIKTYCDFSDDKWNTRRGTQDIVVKQTTG
jgi:thymidylate synthase ThyX